MKNAGIKSVLSFRLIRGFVIVVMLKKIYKLITIFCALAICLGTKGAEDFEAGWKQLPSELKARVLSYLDKDIQNIKLVNKSFQKYYNEFSDFICSIDFSSLKDSSYVDKALYFRFDYSTKNFVPYVSHYGIKMPLAKEEAQALFPNMPWPSGEIDFYNIHTLLNQCVPVLSIRFPDYNPIEFSVCESFSGLCEALEKNKTLKTLEMSDDYEKGIFNPHGTEMDFIYSSLRDNFYLTTLILENNDIASGATIFFLAEALKKNEILQNLTIRKNHLPSSKVSYLAGMLMVNTSLKRLDLSHNFIDKEGALSLGKALQVNADLIYLNLIGNFSLSPVGYMHSWVGSFFGSDPRILKIGEEALRLFNQAQQKNGIEIII